MVDGVAWMMPVALGLHARRVSCPRAAMVSSRGTTPVIAFMRRRTGGQSPSARWSRSSGRSFAAHWDASIHCGSVRRGFAAEEIIAEMARIFRTCGRRTGSSAWGRRTFA